MARDLSSYDVFVLASAENNPLFADVYAIRFAPFAVDRITADKRVSSLGADEKHVMVAAADQDVDRLAQVTGTGELLPVPGLGRPFAYSPTVVGGVMYYEDFIETRDGTNLNRYLTWDLQQQRKTVLFRSEENIGSPRPTADGGLILGKPSEDGQDQVVLRNKSGQLTRLPLGGDATVIVHGERLIAATMVDAGDEAGTKPEAILLLDPKTGKKQRIEGLQVICWNPQGTRLLARRTASPTESRLVLLDPAKPNAPIEIATVPGLMIYSGTWVRGSAAS